MKKDSIKDFYYKYKSNNWLKRHGFNMRRKPFRRRSIIKDKLMDLCLDEVSRCFPLHPHPSLVIEESAELFIEK